MIISLLTRNKKRTGELAGKPPATDGKKGSERKRGRKKKLHREPHLAESLNQKGGKRRATQLLFEKRHFS